MPSSLYLDDTENPGSPHEMWKPAGHTGWLPQVWWERIQSSVWKRQSNKAQLIAVQPCKGCEWAIIFLPLVSWGHRAEGKGKSLKALISCTDCVLQSVRPRHWQRLPEGDKCGTAPWAVRWLWELEVMPPVLAVVGLALELLCESEGGKAKNSRISHLMIIVAGWSHPLCPRQPANTAALWAALRGWNCPRSRLWSGSACRASASLHALSTRTLLPSFHPVMQLAFAFSIQAM